MRLDAEVVEAVPLGQALFVLGVDHGVRGGSQEEPQRRIGHVHQPEHHGGGCFRNTRFSRTLAPLTHSVADRIVGRDRRGRPGRGAGPVGGLKMEGQRLPEAAEKMTGL